MAKSFYFYISRLWKKKWKDEALSRLWKERIKEWKEQPSVFRIERPTRLDRARKLGWKPIRGIVLVRVRVKKGWRKRKDFPRSRKTKNYRFYRSLEIPLQVIAEQRAQRKYPNLEVSNSYYVGEDGVYEWYEVIMIDPNEPSILSREEYAWISTKKHRKRALRGLTPRNKRRLEEARNNR
ncbi:MAG: 50S ribosomal protein L15e [Candidatus Nanoclepta minutus]|uniref:50S ribosomal protein L15e n=1 Tax=Candidatus Nanoclepta minutus TaxID=1940235 RepID=A0A397WNL7_9ARCH|nr:MAG: 50S ribosomal protein L15e [Candidatus Nanoclepta minutus]